MIKSGRRPSRVEGQPVLLRPQCGSSSDWVEGLIVSVSKPLFRQCEIRIGLLAPFPYEMFKTLVFGSDPSGELARPDALEHETDSFWR